MKRDELQRCVQLRKELLQIGEQIKQERALLMYPKIPRLTGMPKAHRDRDAMAEALVRLEQLEERYARKYAELAKLKLVIEDAIDDMPDMERRILRYRYVMGWSWKRITKAENYSRSQLSRRHKDAVEMLEKMQHNATH